MKPESPVIPGREEITIAKDQPEYFPLPAIRLKSRQGEVITRWKPSEEEIVALVNGESIYLHLWTFGGPLQPIMLEVSTAEEVSKAIDILHSLRYVELKAETAEFTLEGIDAVTEIPQ